MATHKVVFRPEAEDDLFRLYRSISKVAGRRIAGDYIVRIRTVCLSLDTFPLRGTKRDDLEPGLRTIGFERRATIALKGG